MIGIRLGLAVLAAAALVPLLGRGGPDPAVMLAARRLVAERAQGADAALAALEATVAPGLADARRGAARVVVGTDAPGPVLRGAARALEAAGGREREAALAVRALEGALRAAAMGPVPRLDLPPGELASIAAQLDGTAPAADRFADLRRRAEGLVTLLQDALAALDQGSLERAGDLVSLARADHDVLAAWEVEVVTLPVWIATMDAMITSLEDLVEATAAGDEPAALAAADAFAALSEDAAPADRALRIALAEGGSAVTAAPLARLADLLREVARTRLEVASIVQNGLGR